MEITFSNSRFEEAASKLRKPFLFRLYTWQKLPMAAISGMKIKHIHEGACSVTVKHKWLNQNPFRSTFWAVLGMTAEMSTGALLLCHSQSYSTPFRFILVGTKARFHKKAKGFTSFSCEDGEKIKALITHLREDEFAEEIELVSKSYNKGGELVAAFSFYWQIRSV